VPVSSHTWPDQFSFDINFQSGIEIAHWITSKAALNAKKLAKLVLLQRRRVSRGIDWKNTHTLLPHEEVL
jgi:hypothetical protein